MTQSHWDYKEVATLNSCVGEGQKAHMHEVSLHPKEQGEFPLSIGQQTQGGEIKGLLLPAML